MQVGTLKLQTISSFTKICLQIGGDRIVSSIALYRRHRFELHLTLVINPIAGDPIGNKTSFFGRDLKRLWGSIVVGRLEVRMSALIVLTMIIIS